MENLIFSNSKKDIVSQGHEVDDGGNWLFHNKSILWQAIREVNESTFSCFTKRFLPASAMLNIAICGDFSITCSNIIEIVLK